MGCAQSKQPVCRNCQTPVARSYSMHVYHPPVRDGDTYHIVALTSSTLGSLNLNSTKPNHYKIEQNDAMMDFDQKRSNEISTAVIEANKWSQMINENIPKIVPKTPVRTPPGEPETIDLWELMEGLEETSPIRPPHHLRGFSFHVNRDSIPTPSDSPVSKLHEKGDEESNSNSISTSIISEFNPDVISAFRKSLEDLPPANPFHLKGESQQALAGNGKSNGDVTEYNLTNTPKRKDRVVLYFTSLRGVRKTYEDCCYVRVILKAIGVRIDERDVSMHSGFKDELKELLRDGFFNGGLLLPRVFVGNKYIGGAEEIRRLHEEGKLEKLLEGFETEDNSGGVCEACGDVRFVPCETCSGSCKVFYEGDYDDDEDDQAEECDESHCGFQRCPDCNENGIIRCPFCCE